MTADEFKEALKREPTGILSSKILLERIPHIFNGDQELFFNWKHFLSEELKIDSSCIVFIGSSCVGISLNPWKNYKPFDENSDIDLAIISDFYFTTSWRTLRNIGSEILGFSPKVKNAIVEHKNHLIFDGTIATDKILSVLPFHKEWASVAEKLKTKKPTENRVINFRIYKDFESLRAYHVRNLRRMKTSLLSGTNDGF